MNVYNDILLLYLLGDTMHMARLWDTSRDKISGGEGYSLEEVRVYVVYVYSVWSIYSTT